MGTDEIFEKSLAMADLGNVEACIEVADKFLKSGNVSSKERGIFYLNRAAAAGDLDSFVALSYEYLSGQNVERNVELGLQWLEKAAQKNHPSACFDFSWFFLLGNWVIRNRQDAAYWIQEAARAGCVFSESLVNMLYGTGLILKSRELTKSKQLAGSFSALLQNATAGDSLSQSVLGFSLLSSRGHQRSLDEGIRWLKQASLSNDSSAFFYLATCYLWGVGVEENLEQGVDNLKLATEHGHLTAARILKLTRP